MSDPRFASAFASQSFMRASQYFAGLSTGARIPEEVCRALRDIFQADLACFVARPVSGETGPQPSAASDADTCRHLIRNLRATLEHVLDGGDLTEEHWVDAAARHYALAFLPVVQGNRTTALIVIGYLRATLLPEHLLDIYQGLAGLVSAMLEKQKSEGELRKLHHQHQLILNAAGEGIFGLDCHGNHTFVNPAAARMLGYQVEELLGRHSHTLWHYLRPDGQPYPEEECPIYGVCHKGSVYSGEEYFIRRDGSNFPVECVSTPILENGEIVGSVVTFKDISERKQAEAELQHRQHRIESLLSRERHLRRLMDVVSDINQLLLTSVSLDSLLQESCKKLVRYKDYTLAWIGLLDETRLHHAWKPGTPPSHLADMLDRTPAAVTLDTETARAAQEENLPCVMQDLAQMPYSGAWKEAALAAGLRAGIVLPMCPDAYSEALGLLCVYSAQKQDLTVEEIETLVELAGDIGFAINAFRQKEALRRLNQDLEQRVKEEVAKRTEQEKVLISQSRLAALGEMLGAIAHQWRQPLNALGLNIQDLEDAYQFGVLDAGYIQNVVAKSMTQIHFLSQTIDDFRNFFKPDKTKVQFSLVDTIESALALVAAQLRNNHIEYHFEHGPASELLVPGYPNEFKQVVLNVLGNAKDAILGRRAQGRMLNGENGRIRLYLETRPDWVSVKIADNGGGIPEPLLEKVFEPFFTSKEEGQGTGVGLYMAKMIIEKNMGGRIYAGNTGQGALFTIDLPRA